MQSVFQLFFRNQSFEEGIIFLNGVPIVTSRAVVAITDVFVLWLFVGDEFGTTERLVLVAVYLYLIGYRLKLALPST